MSGGPRVAVVLATHDRPGRLRALLDSLAHQTIGRDAFEVVVVDDGSGPETAAVLAEPTGLALRVLRHDPPAGPGAAREAGWRAARAPVIAFTDDDCVADAGWLEAGLAAIEAHPGAIVQGRTDPIPEEEHLRSPFSSTQVIHGSPAFETCNMLYPREVLEAVGGFDPDFGWGGEDTDLAWRALEQGATSVYADAARVFHAVDVLGPLGMLRKATRWHDAPRLHARHRAMARRSLHHGVFWSATHEQLLLAAAGAVVARRRPLVGAALALPYLRRLVWRRSGPVLAPYLLLHDLVELGTVARGALRHRVLVI